MATTFEVFGYLVPLRVVLVALALCIGLSLATSFALTIGWSLYRSTVDRRREQLRGPLGDELLDRLFGPGDTDWAAWVEPMSEPERTVVESLLDEYLRELDGSDAAELRRLGDALGLRDRARTQLESGDEYGRLRALTWLMLLDAPEPCAESSFEPTTVRERAAVARLFHQTGWWADPEAGIALLLDDADEQLSVFGQDTLYRIARADPEPLLSRASRDYRSWPTPLFAQVLAVCRHLDASVQTDLSWLTAALESQTEAIREAAALTLGQFGWHQAIRDQVFLERATADPSPRVRGAVYEMLGAWGDDQALSILLYALVTEHDPRALERGTDALVSHRDDVAPDVPTVLGPAWTWSREHDEYDQLARQGLEPVRG